jgi:endonuclease/exonuclease/phosphatase family metal-dependent hydrolase
MEAVIVNILQNSRRHFSVLNLAILLTVSLIFAITGCDPSQLAELDEHAGHSHESSSNNQVEPEIHSNGQAHNQTNSQSNGQNPNQQQTPQIVIGSFNIQMFGKTKMGKPGVVSILTDIARRFDILAIQELRDKDQGVIPEFLRQINADGSSYAAAVGPRQGYIVAGQTTRYFEQSVFIYDTTKVELVGPTYAAHDRYRIMHRPPFVGQFRCLNVPIEQAFSFALMNVHIDPDEAHVEFEALREIIGEIYTNHQGEDDFILLGDLNDEPHKYHKYQWMRSQHAALPSTIKTNTVQTKAYDNIVFDSGYTSEYRNQAGVMNVQQVYGLSLSDAQLVSDHYPVWAVFSALESPRAEITHGDPAEVIR